MPLRICETNAHATPDVSVVDYNSGFLLVVQEDKRHIGGTDHKPQVIAEAIAAFQQRNRMLRDSELPIHHGYARNDCGIQP